MYDSNTHGASREMTLPPIDPSTSVRRYRAIKEHLFSELSEEAVILSLKNGKYYGLNSVAVVVWRNVQDAATLDEIEAAVMTEYDVDEETCRNEVVSFLETMLNEELIETIDDPGA